MITVREYLEDRFSRANALTKRESDLIGLKWPLKKGWVEKFADFKIADEKLAQLRAIADSRNMQNSIDLIARKERKRLNKLVLSGAMTRSDADAALKEIRKPNVASISPTKQKQSNSNDGFYMSREWRDVRYRALVLHGATCQCCGATRADGKKMHVDHIKPRSKFPALQLSLDNLQILCEDCNMGKSNKDHTDWR